MWAWSCSVGSVAKKLIQINPIFLQDMMRFLNCLISFIFLCILWAFWHRRLRFQLAGCISQILQVLEFNALLDILRQAPTT